MTWLENGHDIVRGKSQSFHSKASDTPDGCRRCLPLPLQIAQLTRGRGGGRGFEIVECLRSRALALQRAHNEPFSESSDGGVRPRTIFYCTYMEEFLAGRCVCGEAGGHRTVLWDSAQGFCLQLTYGVKYGNRERGVRDWV